MKTPEQLRREYEEYIKDFDPSPQNYGDDYSHTPDFEEWLEEQEGEYLSPIDKYRIFEAMERHGGGFCQALARAWHKADPGNKARIEQAFTHLLTDFGPSSPFFA